MKKVIKDTKFGYPTNENRQVIIKYEFEPNTLSELCQYSPEFSISCLRAIKESVEDAEKRDEVTVLGKIKKYFKEKFSHGICN